MTTVIDLACLAQAVYDFGKPVPGPWQAGATRSAWQGFLADGLQAGLYVNGSQSVIAFRGTNISWRLMSMLQDFGADVWLTLGMNSSYFAAATAFTLEQARKHPNLVLCGHSLGGAVSQVVGNRLKLPFATFNAPGVAVFASRNIGDASYAGLAVRSLGMLASAFMDPVQAAADARAALNIVRGLNVWLNEDKVHRIGIHYGETAALPSYVSGGMVEQHSIATVISALRREGVIMNRTSEKFA